MTSRSNEDFAKEMTEAHEKGVPNENEQSTKMDLFNNKVGRGIAKDNSGATEQELAIKVL